MKAPKCVEVPKKKTWTYINFARISLQNFKKTSKKESNVKSKEDEKSKFGNNLTQKNQFNCICLDRIL
jgi:hypothetical protein